jgi:DNA-directed RNA polymerase specialized sigma24 family protein
MKNPDEHSVTRWIEDLKLGDSGEAARRLWERYFGQLARLAHLWLQAAARGVADGEDVALSAFDSFCRGTAEGRFPELANRDELWKLLFTITARKAANQRRRERQLKRGGGRSIAGVDLDGDAPKNDALAQVAATELGPEFTAAVVDEIRRLFGDLQDESLRVVALLRMEGYSNEEIASALDCSLRSIERKVQSIRATWERAQVQER